jgi:hypothetical protein
LPAGSQAWVDENDKKDYGCYNFFYHINLLKFLFKQKLRMNSSTAEQMFVRHHVESSNLSSSSKSRQRLQILSAVIKCECGKAGEL